MSARSSSAVSSVVLAVMAKAPVPAHCKTRLAVATGAERAADLYGAMLLDSITALDQVPASRRVVLVAPEHNGVERVRRLAPARWEVQAQRGADLGERLIHGAEDLGDPTTRVLLLASDSPTLPISPLLALVSGGRPSSEAWLGPCDDGGYYLIGLYPHQVGLLEHIPWSTAEVMAATRARAESLGILLQLLPSCYDVDDGASLDRLTQELAHHPERAPCCARMLIAAPSRSA